MWDWEKQANEAKQQLIESGETIIEPVAKIKKVSASGKVNIVFNTDMKEPPSLSIFAKNGENSRILQ